MKQCYCTHADSKLTVNQKKNQIGKIEKQVKYILSLFLSQIWSMEMT